MTMKRAIFAAILAVSASNAWAQSTPNFSYGQVPTAGMWNGAFASKQDALNFVPLNRAGGTMLGRLTAAPSTVNGAGLNLPPGTAPGLPNNGDLWTTSAGLFARINGSTVGPYTAAGSFPFMATGGTALRTAADRAADTVDVLDFGAKGDGSTDDLAAFQRAAASVPINTPVRIYAPGAGRNYFLSASFTESAGRAVTVMADPGATFSGPGVVYVSRFDHNSTANGPYATEIQSTAGGQIGPYTVIANTGANSATGRRLYYHSTGAGTGGGGDIGDQSIAQWEALSGGQQGFGNWNVAVTPPTPVSDTTTRWGIFNNEFNIVNRGPDRGWAATRGALQTWAGVSQMVPSGGGFAGNTGTNALFGLLFANEGVANAAGIFPKFHNGLLAEPDSITPLGYFAYIAGASTLANAPVSPLTISGFWQNGFQCTPATITNACLALAAGQSIQWVSGASRAGFTSTGTGATLAPAAIANGGTQFQTGTLAGADTPITLTGGKSGAANAQVSLGGNVGFDFSAAGTMNFISGGGYFFSGTSLLAKALKPLQLPAFTVAALPACTATYQDTMAVATDTTAPTYRGALTGGGTVRTPVYCDGVSWSAH